MIEVLFLGTSAAVPTKARNHTAVLLKRDEYSCLFDCGEGTQRQMIISKAGFMRIRDVFISHWHADHWIGLFGLIQTMNLENRTRPLNIYGPEADRFVSGILKLGYWAPRFRLVAKSVPYEGQKETKLMDGGDFEVLSTPVKHTVPSVAYCFKEKDRVNVDIKKAEKLYGLKQGPLVGRLKEKGEVEVKGKKVILKDVGYVKSGLKVVYSGDTIACKTLESLAKDADLLIHDSTFEREEQGKMHAGAVEAAGLAKKSAVKRLVLTHFSRRYTNTKPLLDEARKVFPNTTTAEDFTRIRLKREE